MKTSENSSATPFADSDVEAAFGRHEESVRSRLLALRELILEAARTTDGVGDVVETLKWGQPSYLTVKPKSGTTIRIDATGGASEPCGVYFHCQSRMIQDIKEVYPDVFEFEGKRALILPADKPLPEDELLHCFAMALTYHKKVR